MISMIFLDLSSNCLANTVTGNASVIRSIRVSSAISCFLLHSVTIRRQVACELLEWMVVSTP